MSHSDRIRFRSPIVPWRHIRSDQLRAFHAITRPAFTLVEMLVATGAMIAMVSLLGTIFHLSTNAVVVQRGRTENDQRVRLVETLLRTDLNGSPVDRTSGLTRQSRTFRVLIPYSANETRAPINPATGLPASPDDRRGYFCLSENNPHDDTDDVLALTVELPASSAERFCGRTAGLLPDVAGNYGPAAGNYWPNQPEFDDCLGSPNGAGSATAAEVSYFLRHGNLYRRVMLIRTPAAPSRPDDPVPENVAGAPLSTIAYGPSGTRNFWTDFDYSAIFDPAGVVSGVRFHGAIDLTATIVATTLLNPANRWGFDSTSAPGTSLGLPREFVNNGFIGRFTQAETSASNFGYPGRVDVACPNPMAGSTALLLSDGAVTAYSDGKRGGEDLLLSNVLSFDIKVWDPAASLGPDGAPGRAGVDDDGVNGIDDPGERGAWGSDDGDFVDLGNAAPYGFFCAANCRNFYFGPNRFDTWGPNVDVDGIVLEDNPPYLPVWAGPDGRPGIAGLDDPGSAPGIDEGSEMGTPGSDDFMPLIAIKISVRIYDASTDQVRDATQVYSLAAQP